MATFTSFDGVELHYDVHGPTDGRATVLLHGFAADARTNWHRPGIVDALVRTGRQVVAPDARGHGSSTKPRETAAYADEALVRDVRALFDHLAIRSCDLVGYSMGSMTAIRVAAGEPRVDRLVLGGVGKRAMHPLRDEQLHAIADALEASSTEDIDHPMSRAFRDFADSTGADRRALAAMQRARPFGEPQLHAITAPTLVLAGERDVLARDPERLVEAIPDAVLRRVPGDHLSAVATPEFERALLEFLEDRSARR